MASINAEISKVKIAVTKWIFIGIAIAASITLVAVVVLLNTNSFDARSKSNEFPVTQAASASNYLTPDITKSMTSNLVMIKQLDMDSYTYASKVPWKVVAGKPVNFLLDLSDTSPSANAIGVTITGDKGQSILFFPNSYGHNGQNKIQFQYAFPSPGTFNVDITFGAPEGVNINIMVGAEESGT